MALCEQEPGFSVALEEARKTWKTEGNAELNRVKENYSKIRDAYDDLDKQLGEALEDNRSYKNKISRMYGEREDLVK